MWDAWRRTGKGASRPQLHLHQMACKGFQDRERWSLSQGCGEPEEDPACANTCMCVDACVKALFSA